MIISGNLLLNDQGDAARLSPGFVRIEGEVIAEVVEGELPTSADAGGPSAMVLPGLIDAHTHLPQFEMIGAHGRGLLAWLEGVTFPTERKWADADYARGAAEQAVDQLFAHGTTSACCYATVHHEGTLAALRAAESRGLGGLIGQSLIDGNAPDFLVRDPAAQIDETAALLDAFPPDRRLAAAVTPRFAPTCSHGLMRAAGDLSAERRAHVQTHLAETEDECRLVGEVFGKAYTRVYHEAGLMHERSIFGHGIYLDADDLALLKGTRSVVAHCPTANSFLRSGTMNRAGHTNSGVRVALGSDVGAGYERSMVRVARAMIEAAARLSGDVPSVADAWWQITAGNAEVLGWQDRGALKPGAAADVVLVEPDIDWLSGPVEPLSRLMFAWDDRWVRRTWARGRAVYRSGG